MIAIGVASPSAHGQSNNQHGHRIYDGMRKPRLRPKDRPSNKRQNCNRDHRRNKPSGNAICQPLNRRPRPLRLI